MLQGACTETATVKVHRPPNHITTTLIFYFTSYFAQQKEDLDIFHILLSTVQCVVCKARPISSKTCVCHLDTLVSTGIELNWCQNSKSFKTAS